MVVPLLSTPLATPRAQVLNPMPSQRSATFVNQTLNGLSAAPGQAAPGPMPTAPALTALAARAAGQKGNTVSVSQRVREGNARLSAITTAAAQKQVATQSTAQQGGYKSATGGYSGPNLGKGRGNVGIKDVVQVSAGKYLRKDAGSAFMQLANAYKAATGKTLGITEGWRSNERQQQLYNLYRSGKGNLAAKPGTSVHERGTAADWNGMGSPGSAQFKWLQQNAPKFGWKWAGAGFSQVEPWHWEFG